MKKIAFVMPIFLPVPPVRGGAVETLIHQIIIENEKKKEFSITLFCRKDEKAEDAAKMYKFTHFIWIPVNDFFSSLNSWFCRGMRKLLHVSILPERRYLKPILALLQETKWDAVIIENCENFVYPISKVCIAPLYLHLHNRYLNQFYPENGTDLSRLCHRIITVSNYLKQDVLTTPQIDEKKVRVCLNCVNSAAFDNLRYVDFRQSFRESHGISPDDVVYLFTGRLVKEKGVYELIEAFLRMNHPKAKLLIVGSSWFSSNQKDAYLTQLIERTKGQENRILFTGFIPFEEMPSYYAVADVSVIPSLWEEPGGLVVTEAMASRLPLIVTDAGGNQEYTTPASSIMVRRGDTLLIELENAMRILGENSKQRDAMGKCGRQEAEKMNPTRYFDTFAKILNEDDAEK